MDMEGISPRSAAIIRYHDLYNAIFAKEAAMRGNGAMLFRDRYKDPVKLIPDIDDPNRPFAKRNTQRVKQCEDFNRKPIP